MGDDGVYFVGELVQCGFFVLDIAFGEGPAHKGVFCVCDCSFNILTVDVGVAFVIFCFLCGASVGAVEIRGDPVAHPQDAAVGVALSDVLLQLLVVLQQLDGEEAGGEGVAEAVLVEFCAEGGDASFQLAAVVHVQVPRLGVSPFKNLDDLVEQLVDAFAAASGGRHDRHAEEGAELVDVKLVAALLELVEHIEGHHHREVHVDELGGEVEVALEVAAVHHVEDDVGILLDDMLPDVQFFGGICAEGVGAGQVRKVEGVAAELKGAHLLIDGDTAVVADVFVGVCGDVEDAGFPAVGVADKGHVDSFGAVFGDVAQGTVGFFNAREVVVMDNLLFGLLHGDNLHLFGITAAQRHLKVHDAILDRIFERGVENGVHFHPFDEAHLDDALAESPVTRHADDHAFLTSL